jgi:hypothetical protein
MADNTDNHDFDRYEDGEEWQYRDNWSKVDELLKRISEDGEEYSPDSLHTEEARIRSNRSVARGTTDFTTSLTTLTDDGTWYAVDDDTLYSTTGDPVDFDTVGSIGYAVNRTGSSLHITAEGTFIAGADGEIIRSTDEGQSWSSVQALEGSDNRTWAISENSRGDLIANEYQDGNALWQSTDDGQTWDLIADDDTFSEWPHHIHKARYHPADDDRIICTGGDRPGGGIYRSDDNGETWENVKFFGGDGHLYVGLACHPTDPERYILGSDAADPIEGIAMVHDDGEDPELDYFYSVNSSKMTTGSSGGVFTFRTVETDDGGFYVGSTVNESSESMVVVSDDLDGHRWRSVTTTQHGGWRQASATQGAGETVIDIDDTELMVGRGDVFALNDINNPLYGTSRNSYYGDREVLWMAAGSRLHVENVNNAIYYQTEYTSLSEASDEAGEGGVVAITADETVSDSDFDIDHDQTLIGAGGTLEATERLQPSWDGVSYVGLEIIGDFEDEVFNPTGDDILVERCRIENHADDRAMHINFNSGAIVSSNRLFVGGANGPGLRIGGSVEGLVYGSNRIANEVSISGSAEGVEDGGNVIIDVE